jgi:hypothetical protein
VTASWSSNRITDTNLQQIRGPLHLSLFRSTYVSSFTRQVVAPIVPQSTITHSISLTHTLPSLSTSDSLHFVSLFIFPWSSLPHTSCQHDSELSNQNRYQTGFRNQSWEGITFIILTLVTRLPEPLKGVFTMAPAIHNQNCCFG